MGVNTHRIGDGFSYYCESRLLCFNADSATYTSRLFGTILSTADPVSVVFGPTRWTRAQIRIVGWVLRLLDPR